jgi:LEA14-like dessication related protein
VSSGRPRSLSAALLAATVGIVACSRPEAPTLQPETVKVTSVSPQGLGLEVTLSAKNPNPITLSARSVKARVTLDGTTDLGEVVVPTKVSLPARAATRLVVPVQVKWGNLAAIGLLAAAKPVIPYTVKGTATIGGEGLNVDVPFQLAGTLTREELLRATSGAIPGLPF